MSEQIKKQFQFKLKTFDDVFHAVIIALERLEGFLLSEYLHDQVSVTAVKTDRDLHNDVQNPPTAKLFYAETQLQISALFYQTRFDDEELFHKTVGYFLKDLLMWYGGRNNSLNFDDVDKFFIPVISALDRQVNDVNQIMQTVHKYVRDIDNDISKFSEEEKEKAITKGFEAWLLGQDVVERRMKAFVESGEDIEFTVHQRGTIEEGLERLYKAFIEMYADKTPLLFLDNTRKKYLSDINFDPVLVLSNQILAVKKYLNKKEIGESTYYELYMPCPVCLNNGIATPQMYSIHKDCGGKLYVGDNAHIHCEDCHIDQHIKYWSGFNCEMNHSDGTEVTQLSLTTSICVDFHYIASIGGVLVNTAGVVWLQRYLKNFGEF